MTTKQAHTPLTKAQKTVLRYMDINNIGVLVFDPENFRHVWPQDVRQNESLAERLMAWYPAIARAEGRE